MDRWRRRWPTERPPRRWSCAWVRSWRLARPERAPTLTRYGAWLAETGAIPRCALGANDVPRVRAQRRLDIYSTEDIELLALAAELANARAHLFVATMAGTGLRVGEALALRWQDVKRDHSPVPRLVVTDSKTHKPRVVPMTPSLADVWADVDEVALRSGLPEQARDGMARSRFYKRSVSEHPFPWSYSTIQRTTQGLCADAGIEYRGIHAIRHFYATHLLESGADILAVSRLLGHSSVGITAETYAHTTPLSYTGVLGW